MWPFKKNPYKCKYVEIFWDDSLGDGEPIKYQHRFTNKLTILKLEDDCYGLQAFDLDNINDINKIARLNYGYKKKNYNTPYVSYEFINLCFDIHNRRKGVKK